MRKGIRIWGSDSTCRHLGVLGTWAKMGSQCRKAVLSRRSCGRAPLSGTSRTTSSKRTWVAYKGSTHACWSLSRETRCTIRARCRRAATFGTSAHNAPANPSRGTDSSSSRCSSVSHRRRRIRFAQSFSAVSRQRRAPGVSGGVRYPKAQPRTCGSPRKPPFVRAYIWSAVMSMLLPFAYCPSFVTPNIEFFAKSSTKNLTASLGCGFLDSA